MAKFLILLAFVSLSACGLLPSLRGSAPSSTPVDPPDPDTVSIDVGDGASGTVASGATDGSVVVIAIGADTLDGITRNSALDRQGFSGASNILSGPPDDFQAVAYSGLSGTGSMSATLGLIAETGSTSFTQGATYTNTVETTLPVVGIATYIGGYVATWGSATESSSILHGDATLTANFGGATISGAVTNRTLLTADGNETASFADAALLLTTINGDGTFSGLVTGGQFTGAAVTANITATFEGLIGAANGTEVAGALQIEKTYSGIGTLNEMGVFLAD